MVFRPTYLPFVRGIQDADADSADTQNGKLADAVNVHVHPERANVLSLRPRFIGQQLVDSNTRLCVAGGRVAYVSEQSYGRLQDDGTYYESFSTAVSTSVPTRNYAVLNTEQYASRQTYPVQTVAYAEQTNGDNMAMVGMDKGSGVFAVYYQRVANGRKYAETLWTGVGTGLPRVFVFPRTGGAGFLSIVNSAFSGAITMRLSTTNDGTFGSNITLVGTVLLDVVQNTNGTYSYIYTAGGGILWRRVDEAGATVEGPYTIDVKTSPTYAGIARVSDTIWHIWHGGYPVDGNDTVYCSRLTGGVVTVLGSQANAITPATARCITVGGGAIKVSLTSNGSGSYCYLSGGGGDDPRVGRLFLCNNTSITVSPYTIPLLPMGRIWCDTTFYGARIWGIQQKVAGCWELNPTTETTLNFEWRALPIAYHTVTRGTATPLSTGVEANRSFCVYQTAHRSKALLFGRDSAALTLVDVGYDMPTRGTTVNNSDFDLMIGAVPRYWDGVAFVPCGIPQAPDIGIGTTAGAGSLAAGTYLYAMVWEWSDASGNRQQSAAEIQTVIVPASGLVSIDVHPASIPYDERLIGMPGGMRGVVYRSDVGGTILKRGELYLEFATAAGPPSGLFGATQFVVSDDGTVDFSLGEPLYMSAGGANELAATAMEECYLLRPYADRIIGVSKSFPDQMWYTKTLQVARGIEPNQALYFRLPEIATGLAVQDGNIYWFSAMNCYAFLPQFADDTGTGGGAVDPVPLATGVGCTAPNSIVETPVGVFFIGPRGPWVIARGGGAPTYVGAEVEQFFREFPTCRGAVYNPLLSEVVFAMEADNLNRNHCLIIYNHQTQQWYRWMIGHDFLAANSTAVVKQLSSITCAGGVLAVAGLESGTMEILHLVDDYGLPFTSTDDQFVTGDAREIHPYIETKNFMPSGGPGELFRADRIAVDAVPGDLTIGSSRTDGSAWDTGYVFDQADPPIYRVPTQKCRGVRFRFYTTWNGTTLQDRAPTRFNGVTLYTSPLGRAKNGGVNYRG